MVVHGENCDFRLEGSGGRTGGRGLFDGARNAGAMVSCDEAMKGGCGAGKWKWKWKWTCGDGMDGRMGTIVDRLLLLIMLSATQLPARA